MKTPKPVLVALQECEINASLASFFDNCWTARLGDELNGWAAEATLDSYAEAEEWLDRTARERWPEGNYAKQRPLARPVHRDKHQGNADAAEDGPS